MLSELKKFNIRNILALDCPGVLNTKGGLNNWGMGGLEKFKIINMQEDLIKWGGARKI